MRHSTGKPTKSQDARLKILSRMTCIACELNGRAWGQPNRTEVHHLVDKGTRKLSGGHDATIPLCRWHHRGVLRSKDTTLGMMGRYGPSLALQKKAFVARYGTERSLLERVNAKLGGTWGPVGGGGFYESIQTNQEKR